MAQSPRKPPVVEIKKKRVIKLPTPAELAAQAAAREAAKTAAANAPKEQAPGADETATAKPTLSIRSHAGEPVPPVVQERAAETVPLLLRKALRDPLLLPRNRTSLRQPRLAKARTNLRPHKARLNHARRNSRTR